MTGPGDVRTLGTVSTSPLRRKTETNRFPGAANLIAIVVLILAAGRLGPAMARAFTVLAQRDSEVVFGLSASNVYTY